MQQQQCTLQCYGVDAVVLLVVYSFNVVELDAAAAAHSHYVELKGNSAAV